MRNLWEVTKPRGIGLATVPEKLQPSGIKRLLERAQWAQGIRKKLEDGKRRHEFQAAHGFRKWFKTRCEIAGMKSINIETLMGHSIGISDSYYRATQEELLRDYEKSIDFLTINAEHRLQKEVIELEKNKDSDYIIRSKQQEKDSEIQAMREKYDTDIALLKDAISDMQQLLKNPARLVDSAK
jgi:hypothetical protein